MILVSCNTDQLVEKDEQIKALQGMLANSNKRVGELTDELKFCKNPSAIQPVNTQSLNSSDEIPFVSVYRISQAFEKNEIAAELQFKSKTRLVGRVRSVEKTIIGNHHVINFQSKGRAVNCRFDKHPEDLLDVKKGDLQLAECVGASPGITKSVIFSDCKIIDVADIADIYPTQIRKERNGKFNLIGAISTEVN